MTRRTLSGEIADLLSAQPRPAASAGERADWFDRKASIEDRIADESPWLAAEARELAVAARAEAARLRGLGVA